MALILASFYTYENMRSLFSLKRRHLHSHVIFVAATGLSRELTGWVTIGDTCAAPNAAEMP